MLKLAFVMLEEEFVFSEDVQNFLDYLAVFFQVFGEDEDIINVYAYDTAANEILENIIHLGLEGGWAVSHAIQHYQRFKEPSVTPKGHFSFVTFLDSDILVAPLDIKFGEVLGAI